MPSIIDVNVKQLNNELFLRQTNYPCPWLIILVFCIYEVTKEIIGL